MELEWKHCSGFRQTGKNSEPSYHPVLILSNTKNARSTMGRLEKTTHEYRDKRTVQINRKGRERKT